MNALAFFLSVLGLGATVATAAAAEPRPMVVAYVPNWIDLPAFAETIDYAKVTLLNIAFENTVDAEGNLSFHEGNRALLEKATVTQKDRTTITKCLMDG